MQEEQMTGADTLEVSEMFYSLQGEGARTGHPTLFIRLKGCKTKDACYASGVMCDTEFESGKAMTLAEITGELQKMSPECRWITWTGGEPAGQLKASHVTYFKELGYFQTIETSGLFPVPPGLDFITVSPKVAEHVIKKNFPDGVTELRYVRHTGQSIPEPGIKAQAYFLSPHFDGNRLNEANLRHCITLCKENPQWKLSLQLHKIINIL